MMHLLRRCLAILMTVALAVYGAAATSTAHAHAYSGFHDVHVLGDDHQHDAADHHDDSADAGRRGPVGDPMEPASDHHESGFHSHAAPQFWPADAMSVLTISLASTRAYFFDPDHLPSNARDESPFKPPRTSL
jgi:hypothetical protein